MTNDNDNLIIRNLITTGLGFMNRIRTVHPQNGERYLAVTMALEEGRVTNMADLNKTYYECRVVGREAIELLKTHFTDANGDVNAGDDVKVRAAVRIAGCEVHKFTYSKGDKAGQTGISLRSRLIAITYLTVNGEVVYQQSDGDGASADSAAPQASEQHEPQSDGDDTATAEASTTTPAEPDSDAKTTNAEQAELSEAQKQAMLTQNQVSLDKNDALFEQKRAFLKANGYRWDKVNVAWVKKDQAPVNTAPLHEAVAALS